MSENEIASTASDENKKSTKLYLLRHAETDKNVLKKVKKSSSAESVSTNSLALSYSSLISDKNSTLNHRGKIQAGIVGDYFNTMDNKICAIISSPLIRTVETADIIIKRLKGDSNKSDIEKSIEFEIDERLFCGKSYKLMSEANMLKDVSDLLNELIIKYNGFDVVMVTHNHILNIINKLYVKKTIGKCKVGNCSISCLEFIGKENKPDVLFWAKTIKIKYELVD